MKEVRLGLVCYGGVSLAVYMHGLTKEIFKLVRAARAFEQGRHLDPNADAMHYDSEPAYFAALAALAEAGQPLTVAVDLIAGTSAGGINGICLARALAAGRSLDSIRDLWLQDGDIEELLEGHAFFPWGRGKLWSKLVESVARLGWHPDDGVLNGDLMCQLLYRGTRR